MVDRSKYPGDLGDADREDREHGRDDVVDLARYPGGDADREDRDDGRDDVVDLAPGDAGGDAAIGELLETTHGGTGERVVLRLAVPSPIALAGGLACRPKLLHFQLLYFGGDNQPPVGLENQIKKGWCGMAPCVRAFSSRAKLARSCSSTPGKVGELHAG